jgi:putative ABC transport system permease protein
MDIGIRTDRLMALRLRLPDAKYKSPEERYAFYERLAPRLATIPGAEAAAITTSVPPQGAGQRKLEIEGRQAGTPVDQLPDVTVVTISPSFFDAVGVQLRRGRQFSGTDGAAGSETVIVNEQFARQHFPDTDPLGKRIRFASRENAPDQPAPVWRTIVGLSPSIRHGAPQDVQPRAVAYVPYRQEPPAGAAILVRSGLEPAAIMNAVRGEVQALDPDQPVFTVQTLDEMLARDRWPFRVFGSLFAIFAGIALALSAVGLYAVMAYSVTQRTQEIGVRMALGAEGRQVSWMILRRGLVQLAIGLSIGLAGAFFLSKVLGTLLVQITPNDPVTFATISILLVLVAIAACLIPARRATRVDPLVALRME